MNEQYYENLLHKMVREGVFGINGANMNPALANRYQSILDEISSVYTNARSLDDFDDLQKVIKDKTCSYCNTLRAYITTAISIETIGEAETESLFQATVLILCDLEQKYRHDLREVMLNVYETEDHNDPSYAEKIKILKLFLKHSEERKSGWTVMVEHSYRTIVERSDIRRKAKALKQAPDIKVERPKKDKKKQNPVVDARIAKFVQ